MIDLESLRHASFAPLVGAVFTVGPPGPWAQLRLVEARLLGGQRPEAKREPFSLVFRGTSGLRLAQGTYRFENPSLGAVEIFITQIADGPAGADFEAIFT